MAQTHKDVHPIHIIGEKTQEWLVEGRICRGLAERGIRLTGISWAKPPFAFRRPQWNCSQILACLGGQGEVWIDGRWATCGPGTAYLTGPGVLHAYRAVREEVWQLCWVMYGPAARHCPVTNAEPLLVQTDSRALYAAIEGLYRESRDRSDRLCLEAWAELVGCYAGRIGHKQSGGRLGHVWHQVQRRLDAPWTLEKMAALAGMSTEHFRRLCHEELGRSPIKHLTRLRLRQAAGLLSAGQWTVEAIARSVGYADRFGFSLAFRKEFGVSPGKFRQEPA